MPSYADIGNMFQTLYREMQTTNERMRTMADELERLRKSVEKNNSTIDSAIAAFSGIATQIRNAAPSGPKGEELTKLADDLDAKSGALAAAIAANTPSESAEGAASSGQGQRDPNSDLAQAPGSTPPAETPSGENQ